MGRAPGFVAADLDFSVHLDLLGYEGHQQDHRIILFGVLAGVTLAGFFSDPALFAQTRAGISTGDNIVDSCDGCTLWRGNMGIQGHYIASRDNP